MNRNRKTLVALIAFTLLTTVALAQTQKVEGIINGRSGDTFTLQTADTPKLVVLLTSSTQVAQVKGALKLRKDQKSQDVLVPGLPVRVEGTMNGQNQLEAKSVKFKGNDLEQARAIQSGVTPTQEQAQQNKDELVKVNAALQAHDAALQQQQAQLNEQGQKIAANKATIDANSAATDKRFGEMDDYNDVDQLTILFGNGKVKVEPKYKEQLVALAQKAQTIKGYMIQVKGYASSPGREAVNTKLSDQRANNVANILLQQGHVPLTRMLAPGAMGESRQIATDKAAEGQAENRRVVVKLMQNKGIAGTQ